MNVLFVIPEMNRGGAEKMVAGLANYFVSNENCKVYLAVFDNSDSAYELDKSIEYIRLNCSSRDLQYRIPVVSKIRRIINDNSIQVAYGFSIGASEMLSLAKFGSVCKMIGSERSNPYSKKMSKARKLLQNAVVSKLDGMIFTTEGCKNYYPKRVTNKSIVIPNGFIQSIDNQVNEIELHMDSKDIIAVGNLRKVKDYPTMLKAFALFSTRNPGYTLNIYGEGIEESSIRDLVKRLELSSKVILHGSVEKLEKIYKNACFFVHSSISESWCNAILEALSFGVPCIAADCDFGPREMIENGINGYLYPVGDSQELAACMDKIANSTEMHRKMSLNAFDGAKKFEFQSIAHQYYEFGANMH